MTDTFWIILSITGALWFVYLLANKVSHRIEQREREDREIYESAMDPEDLSNDYFYNRWSQ